MGGVRHSGAKNNMVCQAWIHGMHIRNGSQITFLKNTWPSVAGYAQDYAKDGCVQIAGVDFRFVPLVLCLLGLFPPFFLLHAEGPSLGPFGRRTYWHGKSALGAAG